MLKGKPSFLVSQYLFHHPIYSTLQATPSTSGKKQRMTNLSDEQKLELAAMTSASDMEPGERKRQYSALRRAIYKDASPALVAKFSLAADGERLLD